MATIKAGQTEVGKFYITRTGQVVKILSVGESQVDCLATTTNKTVKIPAALEFSGEYQGPTADTMEEEVEEEKVMTAENSVPEEVEPTEEEVEEEEVEPTEEEVEEEVEEEKAMTAENSVPEEVESMEEEVEPEEEDKAEEEVEPEEEDKAEEEVEPEEEDKAEEEVEPEEEDKAAVLVEPEEVEEEVVDEDAIKEVVDKAKQTIAEMVEPLPEKARRAVYTKLTKAIQSKSKTSQVTHETAGAPLQVRAGSVKDRVIQLMGDGQTRTVSEMAKAVDARYQQVFGILDSLSTLLDTVAAPAGSRAKCAYVKK